MNTINEKVLAGNIVILEYIGYSHTYDHYRKKGKVIFSFHYHRSWAWFMEAWEKAKDELTGEEIELCKAAILDVDIDKAFTHLVNAINEMK